MKLLQSKFFLFLVCFASAWFAVEMTINFQGKTILFKPRTQGNTAVQGQTQGNKYQDILDANIFHGQVYAPQSLTGQQHGQQNGQYAGSSGQNIGEIPVSKLPIKLLGTIVASEGAQSKAIIQSGKEQKNYSLHEAVNNWKIVAILREEVILEQNGKKEKLVLRSQEKIVPVDVKIEVNKKELQALMSNIPVLLQHIKIMPYQDDIVQGLKLMEIVPGTYFDTLALMQEDVLCMINDTVLATFNDLTKLTNAGNSKEFTLTVYRNNKNILIKYIVK